MIQQYVAIMDKVLVVLNHVYNLFYILLGMVPNNHVHVIVRFCVIYAARYLGSYPKWIQMDSSPSYSFKKLHTRQGVSTYYTKPSTISQYTDADEALQDYNKILDELGNHKWSWIIDGDGFEILYALELKTGNGVASLLEGRHGETLQEIRVVNPTMCMRILIKAALAFLPDTIRKKVKILTDRYYSILEFL